MNNNDKNLSVNNDETKENVKFYQTNTFARIISIAFAFIMWFYVMSVESPSYEKVFNVPVEVIDSNSGLSNYNQTTYEVNVTIQGKKSEIDSLNLSDISAIADGSAITAAGRYSLNVIVSVNGNSNLKITDQSISTIIVNFDTRSSVSVPVKPVLVSYILEEGYEIIESEIKLDKTEIVVYGPESVLETIQAANVYLNLGVATKTMTVSGLLELVDEEGKKITSSNIEMSDTKASAVIPIYITKTIPLTVEYKYGFYNENNVDITIEPSTITLKGEASELRDLTAYLLMTIDEKHDPDNIKVNINIASTFINVNSIDEATINVSHKNTNTTQLIVENIVVNNPNNLNYELLDDSIIITLRGDTQNIADIRPSDLEALIDLSNVDNATGTVTVVVTVNVKNPFKNYIYEIGDYKMSVNIN